MSQNQPPWIHAEPQDGVEISMTSTLRREFGIIFRRRRLIAATVFVFLLVAAAYNYGARPLYESVSVISLDEADSSPLKLSRTVDTARLAAALDSQVSLLMSRELALAVASQGDPRLAAELSRGALGTLTERLIEETSLRLGFPRVHGSALPDLVTAFRSRLIVEYTPRSAWVYVKFRAYDPEAAVVAVKLLLDAYVAEAERRTAGAEGARLQRLDLALSERQDRVVETFGKLRQLRGEGASGGAANRDLLEKELARLQDSLITAKENGRVRRALLEETLRVSPGEMLAIPSVREDREVAEATNRIADLESRLARQMASLGDLHPEIVGLRSDIGVSRRRLDARLNAIQDATKRDFRMATREETEIQREISSIKRRLSRMEPDDEESVKRSFVQQRAQAGRQAVGELIAKSVRQSDNQVFFAPRVLQMPERSSTPASPQRSRNFRYALGLGLLAGLSLAWLLAHLDETMKTPEDVKFAIGVPLLGVVPKLKSSDFDPMAPDEGETARLAEVYRVIRTNLVLSEGAPSGSQVVLMTSSREGEGKTSTSCGLAVALARGGHKVLLVDGDLRRATLSNLFSAIGRRGVSDAVSGAPASECIVETVVEGLDLMPSGTPKRAPGQLLDGNALPDIIEGLRASYDWILCDAPPVLAVADATILCRMVDSVIVVIGANATPLGSIRATLDQLSEVGGAVRGVVLNRVDLNRDSHYYKYYYASHYAYYSSHPEDPESGSEQSESSSTASAMSGRTKTKRPRRADKQRA